MSPEDILRKALDKRDSKLTIQAISYVAEVTEEVVSFVRTNFKRTPDIDDVVDLFAGHAINVSGPMADIVLKRLGLRTWAHIRECLEILLEVGAFKKHPSDDLDAFDRAPEPLLTRVAVMQEIIQEATGNNP